MAKVANPRKKFQYNIICPGLNPFLCQKFKTPDRELEVAEHGDTNHVIKTAGIKKIGNSVLDKILSATEVDNYFSNWLDSIQDTTTGGGDLPSIYKKNIVVEQYAPDGQTVVARYVLIDAFPQKINGMEFDRKDSENSVESVEFIMDDFKQY